MKVDRILAEFRRLSDQAAIKGMGRYGIHGKKVYGISIPALRKMAKVLGKDHVLAQQLWDSGIHEARILASYVEDPTRVTSLQLEKWVRDFDSWDLCDQCCSNLVDKTRFAIDKAIQWSQRESEYMKRAGFVLMAVLAVHDKHSKDRDFKIFFPRIKNESNDPRNYVRKAISWALRQIGKRNSVLNRKAIQVAVEVKKLGSGSAKRIAAEALRELNSPKIQARMKGNDA